MDENLVLTPEDIDTLVSEICARILQALKLTRLKSTRTAGDDEKLIWLYLQTSLDRLSRWLETWKSDCDASFGISGAIWRNSEYRDLVSMVTMIEDESSEVLKLLAQHYGKGSSRFNHRSLWCRWQKRPKHAVKLGRIRDYIKGMVTHIDTLITISDLQFEATCTGSTFSKPDIVDTDLCKDVLRNRNQSLCLYTAWLYSALNLNLEIDHFHHTPSRPRAYHFLSTADDETASPRDLLLQPIETAEVKSAQLQDLVTLNSAVDLIYTLKTSSSGRGILRLPDKRNGYHYYFSVCSLGSPISDIPSTHILAANLYQSQVEPSNHHFTDSFTQRQRLDLAYKVAQFAFFNLGTPWLSHLSCDTLKQASFKICKLSYVIQVEPQQYQTTNIAGSKTSIRAQLVALGVLLLEIGLGIHLRASDIETTTIKAESIARVASKMGSDYRSACAYCLSRERDSNIASWDYARYKSDQADTRKALVPGNLSRIDEKDLPGVPQKPAYPTEDLTKLVSHSEDLLIILKQYYVMVLQPLKSVHDLVC